MGYRVKELREVLNMTQEDLAQKSGVSRGTISAMENGSSKATSTRTFVKIARALGTSVDSIFLTRTFNRVNMSAICVRRAAQDSA